MKTKQEIEQILKEYKIKNYTINNDGSVNVDGSVYLDYVNFKKLPISFEKVKEDFDCSGCPNLISLQGAPRIIKGYFSCYACSELNSLQGSPDKVGCDFYCSYCKKLRSLEGSPKEVGIDFSCSRCLNLISLRGSPKEIGGYFFCYGCAKLTSLNYAPLKCKRYENNFKEHILDRTNINTIEADKYLLKRFLLGDFSLIEEYSNKNKIKPLLTTRDFDLL